MKENYVREVAPKMSIPKLQSEPFQPPSIPPKWGPTLSQEPQSSVPSPRFFFCLKVVVNPYSALSCNLWTEQYLPLLPRYVCEQWCVKGRRARHLPRAPLLRCFTRKCSSFLVKNLLSAQLYITPKQIMRKYSAFKRASNTNYNV